MKLVHRIAAGIAAHAITRAAAQLFMGFGQAVNVLADDQQRTVEQLSREEHEARRATCGCIVCSLAREQGKSASAPKGAN